MTIFNHGDKVLLPEWLGGVEAEYQIFVSVGQRAQVKVGEADIWLPRSELTKAPTPGPTEIGYIHTDSHGLQYILTDFVWSANDRNWIRFTGGNDGRRGLWFNWEEISN